jgi:hypothetical protein
VRCQQDSAGHQGRFRGTYHQAPAHGLSSVWGSVWGGCVGCVGFGGCVGYGSSGAMWRTAATQLVLVLAYAFCNCCCSNSAVPRQLVAAGCSAGRIRWVPFQRQ